MRGLFCPHPYIEVIVVISSYGIDRQATVKEVPMLQSVLLAGPFPKSVILDSVYTD
jgi:hypothetical protein